VECNRRYRMRKLGFSALALSGIGLGGCGEWALKALDEARPGDSGNRALIPDPPPERPSPPESEDDEEEDPYVPPDWVRVPLVPIEEDTGESDPVDPPEPPVEVIHDCDSSVAGATWSDGEIWVATTSATTRSGELMVSDTGRFHVYSPFSAESGATQLNESAFYRIENEVSPDGRPQFGNCGEDWIVQDADNDETWTEGDYIYLGTFDLVEGANTLRLNHYCLMYWEGECLDLHFAEDPSSVCDSPNPNSAHFSGELCLVPAEGTK
jgi:hypothetical protein